MKLVAYQVDDTFKLEVCHIDILPSLPGYGSYTTSGGCYLNNTIVPGRGGLTPKDRTITATPQAISQLWLYRLNSQILEPISTLPPSRRAR